MMEPALKVLPSVFIQMVRTSPTTSAENSFKHFEIFAELIGALLQNLK